MLEFPYHFLKLKNLPLYVYVVFYPLTEMWCSHILAAVNVTMSMAAQVSAKALFPSLTIHTHGLKSPGIFKHAIESSLPNSSISA